MTLVFVYGTLKRRGSNHGFLAGQIFIAEALTKPGYTLYRIAEYPGMVSERSDTDGVRGEVWAVDHLCLSRLDALEGTREGLFGRGAVPLQAPFEGKRVEAYFYLRNIAESERLGACWCE